VKVNPETAKGLWLCKKKKRTHTWTGEGFILTVVTEEGVGGKKITSHCRGGEKRVDFYAQEEKRGISSFR